MDKQRQDDQLEPIYSGSVPILDVDLRTCRKQWTIGRGGERGSGISVLIARHQNDDDKLYLIEYIDPGEHEYLTVIVFTLRIK